MHTVEVIQLDMEIGTDIKSNWFHSKWENMIIVI